MLGLRYFRLFCHFFSSVVWALREAPWVPRVRWVPFFLSYTTPIPPHLMQGRVVVCSRPVPLQSGQVVLGSLKPITPLPVHTVQLSLLFGYTPVRRQKAHRTYGSSIVTFPVPPQTVQVERGDNNSKGSIPFPLQKAHFISFMSPPFS